MTEPAYIFKHAVIQDVAYQSLLMQRRKTLHRAVGEGVCLSKGGGPGDDITTR